MNDKKPITVRSFAAATFIARTHEPLGARMSGNTIVFDFPPTAADALSDYVRVADLIKAVADQATAANYKKEPARDLSKSS